MPFGFSLPGRGPLARPDVLVTLAERASFRVPLDLAPKRAEPAGGDRIPFRGAATQAIQASGTTRRWA